MDAVASVGLRTRVWVCMCAKMVNTRTHAQEVCRQGGGVVLGRACWAASVVWAVTCSASEPPKKRFCELVVDVGVFSLSACV